MPFKDVQGINDSRFFHQNYTFFLLRAADFFIRLRELFSNRISEGRTMKRSSPLSSRVKRNLLFAMGSCMYAASALAITDAERITAAKYYAENDADCTSLPNFYWEIGDANGVIAGASGNGGAMPTNAPDPTDAMPIASASKWIFGAYALQRNTYAQIQAAGNIKSLNFTSAYHSMGWLWCSLVSSVSLCFSGSNNNASPNDVGKFYYDPAHLQWYAVNVSGIGSFYDNTGIGTPKLNNPNVTNSITNVLQSLQLEYAAPVLAGGVSMAPTYYAQFLRDILSGNLAIKDNLGLDQVCAWTNLGDCDALYSPVNQLEPGPTNTVSNEKWKYSLAHWVEADPTVGDNAYSSPGLYGFYPWIDASKTYYGILAREDHDSNTAFYESAKCGRKIRKGWLTGQHP